MKNTTRRMGLLGWGAFLLLAALLPGSPVQAVPEASPARCPCAPANGPILSESGPGVGQAFDMDDDDGDDQGGADLVTPQAPLPEAVCIPELGARVPNRGPWALDSVENPHSRPERGCALRKRILKKTR